MKNFEKADIISQLAINKNKSKFLPKNEQMVINNQLKDKLLRFLVEMQSCQCRPAAMKIFDGMMNEMHGQRVKDLYGYRKEGNHVVAIIDSQLPPELIYGIDKFVPVGVCMGAGEVEKYADHFTRGLYSPFRSMIGFMTTGMCVFFNLSDFILGSNLSKSLKEATEIISKITSDFNVFCVNYHKSSDETKLEYEEFVGWVGKISEGSGFNRERFIEYAKLYASIRTEYKRITELRTHSNPPLDGCNTLWIQQLYPVEEPYKLLSALESLRKELEENIVNGIGYNIGQTRKRVLLITPRIMPPFTEIYRQIENNGGLVVCEHTDMGITNIDYQLDHLLCMAQGEMWNLEMAIRYVAESINRSDSSSFPSFSEKRLMQSIKNFNIDAVVCFNFMGSTEMDQKIVDITKYLHNEGIPVKTLRSDYLDMYQSEKHREQEFQLFFESIGRTCLGTK